MISPRSLIAENPTLSAPKSRHFKLSTVAVIGVIKEYVPRTFRPRRHFQYREEEHWTGLAASNLVRASKQLQLLLTFYGLTNSKREHLT